MATCWGGCLNSLRQALNVGKSVWKVTSEYLELMECLVMMQVSVQKEGYLLSSLPKAVREYIQGGNQALL